MSEKPISDEEMKNLRLLDAMYDEAFRKVGYLDKKQAPVLYEVVSKQAKELGIDMEKDGIKIYIMGGDKNDPLDLDAHNLKMSRDGKTLFIGQKVFGSDYAFMPGHPEMFSLSAFDGDMRHELQHHNDLKEGRYGALPGFKEFLASGDFKALRKANECRADFASPGNEGRIEELSTQTAMFGLFAENDTHPSASDRLKSAMIQWYIKEETGVILTPNDVKFNKNCEFSITNKEKLHAIPPDVLQKAYEIAEKDSATLEKMAKESSEALNMVYGIMNEAKTPSVPLRPKEPDARRGIYH